MKNHIVGFILCLWPEMYCLFPAVQDVVDLLRGDSALLDAAKKGNLSRVQKLVRNGGLRHSKLFETYFAGAEAK